MGMTFPLYVASSFLSLLPSKISRPRPTSSPSNFRRCCNSLPSKPISFSDMDEHAHIKIKGHKKLMEFPHLTSAHRDLMVGIISALENRLEVDSHLLPSSVPPDVEFYQNENGTAQGSLHIRRGVDSSHIDFILASWLHLKLPTGSAMNITNLQGYLKPSTGVPHFQFELVQCSPTYLILFLDITPRKDLVLHPDYLKTFYEETQLETYRQKLEQVPETKPYFSSSLYFRHVVSPTGILISVKCEEDGGLERSEEIIREHVSPIAYDVMGIWLEKIFVSGGRNVGATERDGLAKRDGLIKSRAVEMDLSSTMPMQFGQEVADRVLGVIKSAFGI